MEDIDINNGGKEKKRSPFYIILTMLPVAVALSAMIYPRFQQFIRSANERSNIEKIKSFRYALDLYRVDNDQNFPDNPDILMQPGNAFLSGILDLYTIQHGTHFEVIVSTWVDSAADTGAWGYVNAGEKKGVVWIQCTHVNSFGKAWSEY